MELLPILFLFIFLVLLLYNLLQVRDPKQDDISERLQRIRNQAVSQTPEEELNRSFSDRVIKPLMESVGKSLIRLAPKEMISNLENKIIMAGRPRDWDVNHWLVMEAALVLGLPVLILLTYIQLRIDIKSIILVAGSAALIGLLFPNMSLNNKIRKRQSEVMKTLPDIMDLLTVSVEAGLSFDSALSKVAEKMPGTLAKEFEVVLQEMKVGKSKKDALYQMSDRIGIQDFRSFVSAVVQAEQLGVSLGKVLRIQSEQIRNNRKQIIQQKAMKAPVKMLIPMVVFIFPTIFIVILGPVVINLIDMFSKK